MILSPKVLFRIYQAALVYTTASLLFSAYSFNQSCLLSLFFAAVPFTLLPFKTPFPFCHIFYSLLLSLPSTHVILYP